MLDWNVLINVHEHSFSRTYLLLEELGRVYQSDFEDVLLLKVENIASFLEAYNSQLLKDPTLSVIASSILPVASIFSFQSQAEFETKAKKAVLEWLPALAGKKFYVRMHRRGMKDHIDRHEEETFLDLVILQELEKIGKPGQIGGIDPDIVVAVETISQQAGLSYWTRQNLEKYPWLKLDLPKPLLRS